MQSRNITYEQVKIILEDRICIKCDSNIESPPHWIMGSPPAGVNACIKCENCEERYIINKHRLSDIDTEDVLSSSEYRNR